MLGSFGGARVGLGIGVPATSSPCSLTQSVTAQPGVSPHIEVTADAGSYCVQLFDVGGLADETPFSVTVEHP